MTDETTLEPVLASICRAAVIVDILALFYFTRPKGWKLKTAKTPSTSLFSIRIILVRYISQTVQAPLVPPVDASLINLSAPLSFTQSTARQYPSGMIMNSSHNQSVRIAGRDTRKDHGQKRPKTKKSKSVVDHKSTSIEHWRPSYARKMRP